MEYRDVKWCEINQEWNDAVTALSIVFHIPATLMAWTFEKQIGMDIM